MVACRHFILSLCICVPAWEGYDNIFDAKEALEEFWASEEADQSVPVLEGKRIAVFFPSGAKGWYNGTVQSYDAETNSVQIQYDDTTNEKIELGEYEDDDGNMCRWQWKRGEYTKAGKHKPPKKSHKKAKKEVEKPLVNVPELSLADMTQRFDSMLKEKLEEAAILSPMFTEHAVVVELRRKFIHAVKEAGGSAPLSDSRIPAEFQPVVASLIHEKVP